MDQFYGYMFVTNDALFSLKRKYPNKYRTPIIRYNNLQLRQNDLIT